MPDDNELTRSVDVYMESVRGTIRNLVDQARAADERGSPEPMRRLVQHVGPLCEQLGLLLIEYQPPELIQIVIDTTANDSPKD